MAAAVLAINAGSSSLKFALYRDVAGRAELRLRGRVERIPAAPAFRVETAAGETVETGDWTGEHDFGRLLARVLAWCEAHLGGDRLEAAGHRVVHGGAAHAGSEPVTPRLMEALAALSPLAPLHQPHNLAPIRAIAALRPGLPQVACFDTAFHRTVPDLVTRFALPRRFHDRGLRRYGFHGLSFEWIARRLAETEPALARGRVVVAHLGNGASLCAMVDGRSRDMTTGFSATEGLMMATRSGQIDPGAVLHLIRGFGMTPEAVDTLLNCQSGLLGVSGVASDMRELLASPAPEAREAIDLFVHRVLRCTGEMAASMGGIDGFVFTGGIGEHAAPIRAAVAEGLGWLGARIAPSANAAGARVLDADPVPGLALRRIATDEEAMIATHTLDLIGAAP
ncbi:acetate/propionate family kinase [Frigidibacter sp. MR17.24]|uniref:acetate/propionate family kinase n=1 Tax=Frigidibacter sp. MR17.24 TaxID=3127345 RepID=UPI003012B5B4